MSQDITPLRNDISIGVITIRLDETDHFLSEFNVLGTIEGQSQTYSLCEAPNATSESRRKYIAHICLLEQGPESARKATHQLLTEMQPDCIVVVGIAGGTPNEDFFLGDVVISRSAITPERVASEVDGSRSLQAGVHPPNKNTEAILNRINALIHKLPYRPNTSGLISPNESILEIEQKTKSQEWKDACKDAIRAFEQRSRDAPPKPVITIQSFFSSTERVRSPEYAATIISSNREAKVFEMELAGCLTAAKQQKAEIPIISIRGISDIIGIKRNQSQWNKIASSNAAQVAGAIIKHGLLQSPPEKSTTKSRQQLKKKTPKEKIEQPLDLCKLGAHKINIELLSPDDTINPDTHFNVISRETKRGENHCTLGWNVRPTKELNAIHLAYLQILGRFAEYNFKIQINIYDICTTKEFKEVELKTLSQTFIAKLQRFRGISPKSVSTVSGILKNISASAFAMDMFKIARVSLSDSSTSFSDPATTFDNLLCMVVEEEAKYNIILAGGKDSDEYWRNYRKRLDHFEKRRNLSLMLVFPELRFGSPREMTAFEENIPTESDSAETIMQKLTRVPPQELPLLWDAIVAPSGVAISSNLTYLEALSHGIYQAFRESRYLK